MGRPDIRVLRADVDPAVAAAALDRLPALVLAVKDPDFDIDVAVNPVLALDRVAEDEFFVEAFVLDADEFG